MKPTAERVDKAEKQFEILDDVICDLRRCIKQLKKDSDFSDYVSDLESVLNDLVQQQYDNESVLVEWADEQRKQENRDYERSKI